VSVTKVERDEKNMLDHVLLEAKVSRGNPVFDDPNHVKAGDSQEPIRPFELLIANGDVSIGRTHIETVFRAHQTVSPKRWGRSRRTWRSGWESPILRQYGQRARRCSRNGCPSVSDTERAPLNKCVSGLQQTGIQIVLFKVVLPYHFLIFNVNGVVTTADPHKDVGGVPIGSKEWPIEFFRGLETPTRSAAS
jgi:hypothetical protein